MSQLGSYTRPESCGLGFHTKAWFMTVSSHITEGAACFGVVTMLCLNSCLYAWSPFPTLAPPAVGHNSFPIDLKYWPSKHVSAHYLHGLHTFNSHSTLAMCVCVCVRVRVCARTRAESRGGAVGLCICSSGLTRLFRVIILKPKLNITIPLLKSIKLLKHQVPKGRNFSALLATFALQTQKST